ncbi:MAG: hypothetical protein FP810_15385 [Desulfocapsa sp.]|nr:hypothetical protein [Desulfocapsa sp.]
MKGFEVTAPALSNAKRTVCAGLTDRQQATGEPNGSPTQPAQKVCRAVDAKKPPIKLIMRRRVRLFNAGLSIPGSRFLRLHG